MKMLCLISSNFSNEFSRRVSPVITVLTDLRKLAQSCEFKKQESSLLRDRIFIGIIDTSIQERLLRDLALNMEDAAKICRAHKASKGQLRFCRMQEQLNHKRYKKTEAV